MLKKISLLFFILINFSSACCCVHKISCVQLETTLTTSIKTLKTGLGKNDRWFAIKQKKLNKILNEINSMKKKESTLLKNIEYTKKTEIFILKQINKNLNKIKNLKILLNKSKLLESKNLSAQIKMLLLKIVKR